MTDVTTPKTAEELIDYGIDFDDTDEDRDLRMGIHFLMQQYARSVAQQVRQQCAQEAKVKLGEKKITEHGVFTMTVVDKESILSVDIEQFLL